LGTALASSLLLELARDDVLEVVLDGVDLGLPRIDDVLLGQCRRLGNVG
jgi:hypothetical protein